MSVLPYCIFLAESQVNLPDRGVQGSELNTLLEGPLRLLYSEMEQSRISAETFQRDAVAFHDVVHTVFDHAAVLPFRFPMWLARPELETYLRHESQRYGSFLTEHAAHVQMEVRLTASTISSQSWQEQTASPGTEHLRQRATRQRRLRVLAEQLRERLAREVIEWRERETLEGVRLYALTERSSVPSFREKLATRVEDNNLRFSGPWPATEFLVKS